MIQLIEQIKDSSSEPLGDEHCSYQAGDEVPISRFDNYKWRGPLLAHLSLFEYCMLVRTTDVRYATESDIEFHPGHPKSCTYV